MGARLRTGAARWRRWNAFSGLTALPLMRVPELPRLLDPVVEGRVDYSKANRLLSGQAYRKIPKVRYFGNSVLSLLTKIASGYWHIADSQTGYTAINKRALKQIDWDRMYKHSRRQLRRLRHAKQQPRHLFCWSLRADGKT